MLGRDGLASAPSAPAVPGPCPMTLSPPVPVGLDPILERIAKAARAADRDPSDVTLVAVSKQQPWERIAPVLAAGQRAFGENRVQEAMTRWTEHRSFVG